MVINAEVAKLVQVTLRTFYEHKYVILIDQLVRKEAMRDEELAARIGLNSKEMGKLANKLAEDGFLATHRRSELRPGAMKATPRTWYYIDYQRTVDNIKWRMFRIRKVIDDKLRNELDSQGYVCPRCKKAYSTLDAGALMDMATNTLRCDVCGTEVIDNENVEEVKRSKDQMNRLLGQTKPIIEGLKKTETIRLPAMDIAGWLEKNAPIAAADLLPTASGSAPAKVTVELVDGDDKDARLKKEAEADAKRQQNALPTWIERSTITGELTAVGAAQHTAHTAKHNDAYGSVQVDRTGSPKKGGASGDGEGEVDDYYAKLAAAQAAAQEAATMGREASEPGSPTSSSFLANGARLVDSGYEDFIVDRRSNASPGSAAPSPAMRRDSMDHVDVKPRLLSSSLRPPSSASLTMSLGKRSREPSEESDFGKKAKTENNTAAPTAENSPVTTTATIVNGTEAFDGPEDFGQGGADAGDDEEGEEAGGDDPMLTVAGVEMPFSSITEEMTSNMTPDEYQLWWETLAVVG